MQTHSQGDEKATYLFSHSDAAHYYCWFPIIEPDPGHTKLRLSREGLEAIERRTTPIAAVAVIGPYRSGKSFLLNQLLSLSCYKGFGVGHMRDTKTKGIWVWGAPLELDIDGVKTSVFYLDIEGFESVRKSNVYNDRIFPLATIMSSVLIYNLLETIREADISRLSFAVEFVEESYGRYLGQDVVFEPAKLLWIIQRDFLQKCVRYMLRAQGDDLEPFDSEIERTFRRRRKEHKQKQQHQMADNQQIHIPIQPIGQMAARVVAPPEQQHERREINEGDLSTITCYGSYTCETKFYNTSIIRQKIVQGKTLTGKEFVSFLKQILEALNKGEIPSTGSLLEVFNKGILDRYLKL
ncbi:guanylate-binding 4 [Olea europaea subsp. europaea]|uniref:Guanylate-binding 4 n=1 Tax=Olea europaea subsp. europaea TaxID=158383 RepID=A0A8S0QZI1_OLEEU|nr:guanylate-binding 4 [Olea europaea subsp. europaea]